MVEFKEIKRVLVKILVLNWLVAFAKIFIGIFTGTLSILTDGLHSFFDGVTNIIGFFGIRLAEKSADRCHPYGHRKYEAVASLLILFFLGITAYEILKSIFQKISHPSAIDIDWFVLAILLLCILIDYFVARYEHGKGKELKSTILKADSSHTRSHYITTGAVILGNLLIKLGLPDIIDPIVAAFVVLFILKLGYEIFKETTAVLTDMALVDEGIIKKMAELVPGVASCRRIRSRGDEGHIFMDFQLVLQKGASLEGAHKICEKLKKEIQAEIPEVKDIMIHIEPDK